MRPRRITADRLAKAYEMVSNGSDYKDAAKEIRCSRSYLNTLIKRCEREGIEWLIH